MSFHSMGKIDSESIGTERNVLALCVHALYDTSAQSSALLSKFLLISAFLESHPRDATNLTWSTNTKSCSMVGCLRLSICRTMEESSEHTSTGILACSHNYIGP